VKIDGYASACVEIVSRKTQIGAITWLGLTFYRELYFHCSFTVVLWIHCSVWNNCSTSVQRSGCTFHDLLTEVLQYSRWSQFNTYDLNQQRYNEAVDSLYHLCSNIEPGTYTRHSVTAGDIEWFHGSSTFCPVQSLKLIINICHMVDR